MDSSMVTENDLIIYSEDDEGAPWCAFVWGEADPQEVAALIPLEAVENATGYDEQVVAQDYAWPPDVGPLWLRPSEDNPDVYFFCEADHPEASQITGHRFSPKHRATK